MGGRKQKPLAPSKSGVVKEVFDSVVRIDQRHNLQSMVFWSMSDFSYLNHVHATELVRLFGTKGFVLAGVLFRITVTFSLLHVCFCCHHANILPASVWKNTKRRPNITVKSVICDTVK